MCTDAINWRFARAQRAGDLVTPAAVTSYTWAATKRLVYGIQKS
jgi:hypothetical protein